MENKDSLEQAVGKEVDFEIKGVSYKLTQVTIGDYQKLRGHVRTQRIKDFVEASKDIPTAMVQQTLRELASHIMSEQELAAEAMTVDGQVFMLWRMIFNANENFGFTYEEFTEMIDETTMNNMLAVMGGIADEVEEITDPPVAGTD